MDEIVGELKNDYVGELIDELKRTTGGERAVIAKLLGRIEAAENELNRVRHAVGTEQRETLMKQLERSIEHRKAQGTNPID